MSGPHGITDLAACPALLDTVVDRVWNAWWRPRGEPRARVAEPLRHHLSGAGIPFTLVAHEGGRYRGSVLVIASDLASRPQYSPWVAALWVDPEHRRRGLGAALLEVAARRLGALGTERVFLCARPVMRGFYEASGWRVCDAAPEEDLVIFARSTAPAREAAA